MSEAVARGEPVGRAGPRRRPRWAQRRRQVDPVPVRRRAGAERRRRRAHGHGQDRRPGHEGDARRHQLAQHAGILFQESQTQITSGAPTVWEEIAFGPRNLSLTLDEVVERTWTAIDALRLRRHRRPRSRAAIGRPGPARRACGGARARAQIPRARRADLAARSAGHAPRRRHARQAATETGVGVLIAEHKTDLLARMCDEIAVINAGRDRCPRRRRKHPGRPGPPSMGSRAARGRGTAPGRRRSRIDVARRVAVTDRHRARDRRPGLRLPGRHARAYECLDRLPAGSRVAIVGQNGSRQIDARAPFQRTPAARQRVACWSTARASVAPTWQISRAWSASRSRTRTGRSSRPTCAPRCASVRATSACAAPIWTGALIQRSTQVGLTQMAGRQSVRPGLLGAQAARAGVGHRDGHARDRARRADHRPGRERRRARQAHRRRAGRGRPYRRRHQPRHGLRRRGIRARHRHARRPRRARRPSADVFGEKNWGVLESTFLEPPSPPGSARGLDLARRRPPICSSTR